jgi:tetratricopeptide (TPR) repeat protein
MKRFYLSLIVLVGIAVANAYAQPTQPASLTDSRIADDRQKILQNPNRFQAYNDLALQLIGKFSETGDPSLCTEAEQAMKTALTLVPENPQVLKTQVVFLLARHEFAQARSEARVLNSKMPDDVSLYGYLATADIELGNYADAETEAQWMLNLLPNNVPGLLIGARLRELYGDAEGALMFLNQAYAETSPAEIQELASIGHQIAGLQINNGKLDAAEQVIQQVLKIYPGYLKAIEDLAQVRVAQGQHDAAIELLARRNQRFPTPQSLYALARILERAGRPEQSKTAYAQFERAATTQSEQIPELILYYVDAKNPGEALRLARGQIEARRDVFTLDAYAWALFANQQYGEARDEIEKALKVGIRDAQIFYHGAVIAAKQNDPAAAARYFADVLQTNPSSEYAPYARKAIPVSAEPVAGDANSMPGRTQQPVLPPTQSVTSATPPITALPTAVSAAASPATPGIANFSFQPVPKQLLSPAPTETDRLIRSLQSRITREPDQSSLYASLGAAFFQKARETGDVSHFELAEKALHKSLDLISNDLAAAAPRTTLAEVYMGEHRFADALASAQKSLSLGSGDPTPFAIAGDAYADMGEYDKAMEAYDKLEGASGGSYVRDSRVAFLKFISGDTGAAIQLMQRAIGYGIGARLPNENLAWLYYELGEYYFQNGNAAEADRSYLAALTIHPGDYRALAGLAKVRATQGLYSDAIELYQKALAVVPMPLFAAELGDVYAKAGRPEDAKKQFDLVEYIGTLGTINKVLHNRDLALFLADHDNNLAHALDLAQKEFEVRHDIYTWDVLAWVLYKNGKLPEAADAMAKALRFSTRDALLFFHAGTIYRALGQPEKAREYLNQALAINSHFHVSYAAAASRQLAEINQLQIEAQSGNGKAR